MANIFLFVDYSQIELRCLAELSQDTTLLDIYSNNGDVHTQTAALSFKIEVDNVTKEQRQAAKSINFGIIFGMTAEGLSTDLNAKGMNYSIEDCEHFISDYLEGFSGVKHWINKQHEFVRQHHYVVDFFGRKRHLYGIHSTVKRIQSEAERMSQNTPVQSTAQGIIKRAMVELTPYVCDIGGTLSLYRMKPSLQLHDELIFTIRESELEEAVPVIQDIMENTTTLSIPLPVDVKLGYNWRDKF